MPQESRPAIQLHAGHCMRQSNATTMASLPPLFLEDTEYMGSSEEYIKMTLHLLC